MRTTKATCVKPAILHVSGEFPDSFQTVKTPVIRRLIDLSADVFDHNVVSLNRETFSKVQLC
ncbi:hypothetical protein [Erythrobacter sp.]|uniref:hypothetical protein n=1 Tax=Erythrobacter sp. TaxID=1042 RepID=UPI003C72E6CB